MRIILSYGIISLLFIGCWANDLFLQKPAAARFLSRFRRANSFAEELKQGKLERECLEETCSKEEVREVFENDLKTEMFWDFYTGRAECESSPCKNNGTCVDMDGELFCRCPGGFNGTSCELEINECELMQPCPLGTTCVDGINKFTCNCPVDGCSGTRING
ncbi:coagulation factor X-like [Cetorhinus maximus]